MYLNGFKVQKNFVKVQTRITACLFLTAELDVLHLSKVSQMIFSFIIQFVISLSLTGVLHNTLMIHDGILYILISNF